MTLPSPQPAPRVATRRVVVKKITSLSPRVKNFHFEFLDSAAFRFQPGQYVQVIDPQVPKPLRRSYSIASPPSEDPSFDLCITHVEGGGVSSFLHSFQGGETVDVVGPMGRFTLPESLPRDTVFIATGSGIAPFRSMFNDLLQRGTPRSLYLIFGNRFEEDILYKGEWEALKASHSNFQFLYTLSRPGPSWPGEKGYVQEKIQTFIPDVNSKDYYICGLNAMITQVRDKLLNLGVPKEQIHYERYD